MKFENTRVMNFEGAFRGARNPMNSWDKSDSFFGIIKIGCSDADWRVAEKWVAKKNPENKRDEDYWNQLRKYDNWLLDNGFLARNASQMTAEVAFLGPNDMELAQKLIKYHSPEQRKFLRQILVSVDITAPLLYWKEFDTYKIGTTANSTSTMHKLASTPITIDCFETDDYSPDLEYAKFYSVKDNVETIIDFLEGLRVKYNETKDMKYWRELIRWLPESWLQTRTVTMNYENLLSICKQRKNHKLIEWHMFIDWAKTLPYAEYLIFN